MVLSRVTINSLNEIDKTMRGLMRKWIALPTDFYVSVAEGRLDITSLTQKGKGY